VALRIAFLGNDPWSVPSLVSIDGDPELAIELVVTNPPKPAGRGNAPTPTAVARAARSRDLPVRELAGVASGDGSRALEAVRPDVLVVVAYGALLPPATLGMARHGAINLHFSLLPRWRGAAPVQRALMAGDEITGVTVMRMDEGLDTGPILSQLEEPVRADDDAGALGGRLAPLGARLLVSVLRMLPAGGVPARDQDERVATLAPRIHPVERVLDWSGSAADLVRRVRGLAPEPGATTTFRGQPIKVLGAALDHEGGHGEPGAVIAFDDRGVLVGAGDGAVRLLEVAPSGRKRMDAAAWARGARFGSSDRLG
jgi:methionyl-tRNA formyltransferase